MDEEAKAVQEAAKTARKALELAEKAGPFLERVFGPPIEDAVGIVAERLRYYRLKNWLSVQDKTQVLLDERGVTDLRHVGAPVALPLIEAAAMEEDDSLRERWAALLAAALDPDRPPVKRSFISIFAQMEAIDVAALDLVYDITFGSMEAFGSGPHPGGIFGCGVRQFAERIRVSHEEAALSLHNLSRLECIDLSVTRDITVSSIYMPVEQVGVRLTALGKAFVDSCRP